MHQHVWLPSLRVWAPVAERPSSSSSASSSSLSSRMADRSYKIEAPSFPLEVGNSMTGKRREKRRESQQTEEKDNYDEGEKERRERRRRSDHSCPICLCAIDESELSVLRWCMHGFCVECIEKWSNHGRFCPLCKQTFHGWYYNIRSSHEFDVKELSELAGPSSSSSPSASSSQILNYSQVSTRQRIHRHTVSMVERRSSSEAFVRRSQPLPWRRSFGSSNSPSCSRRGRDKEVRANEILKWRASVYKRNLRAIPPQINRRLNQEPIEGPDRKARIEKRLEPWIIRELHALTGDPEPFLLVQLVLSLWVNVIMHKDNVSLQESEAIEQLKPFLDEKAAHFWHEMKCFAESPFSLMAYDSVVIYKR